MSDITLWWITLGAGLVVIVVAVALLHLLLSQVSKVQEEVEALWEEAGRAASNTATSWMLRETAEAVHALTEELHRHREFGRRTR